WRIAILRLSNISGAFEHGVLGEAVPPLPKNIVPLTMQVATQQREYLELRSQAYTADGTVERSFLHVADSCDAVIKSLQWLWQQQELNCEAFNIAGTLISILDLLDELAEVTPSAIRTVDALPYPHAELDQLGANIEKAQQILHWQPQRSLKKMLEDEWLFYQNILRGQ